MLTTSTFVKMISSCQSNRLIRSIFFGYFKRFRNSRTSGRVLESSARDLTPNWGIDPLSSNSGALSALEPMVPNGIDGIGTGRHLGSWATSNN